MRNPEIEPQTDKAEKISGYRHIPKHSGSISELQQPMERLKPSSVFLPILSRKFPAFQLYAIQSESFRFGWSKMIETLFQGM